VGGVTLLEIRNLKVSYNTRRGKVEALSGVSLDVKQGEVLGVVGESGSGKSTLGLAIMRILPRYSHIEQGEIFFDGRDILKLDDEELREMRGKEVSIVFQDPYSSLNPVRKIVDHFIELFTEHGYTYEKEEIEKIASQLLEKMGVPPEKLHDYPHQLSGGQRQRVAIALGLALNPKLLIADEITTALDALVEAQIVELLKEIKKDYKTSIMFITHNMGLVAQLADRIAVMYAGKLVEVGKTSEVIEKPRHPYTRALLLSVPRIGGSKALQPIPGEPPDMRKPPSGCRFHPRCPLATDLCVREIPVLRNIGDRYVACHYA
jgi:peptide/nickel transport system ATP-binding protein